MFGLGLGLGFGFGFGLGLGFGLGFGFGLGLGLVFGSAVGAPVHSMQPTMMTDCAGKEQYQSSKGRGSSLSRQSLEVSHSVDIMLTCMRMSHSSTGPSAIGGEVKGTWVRGRVGAGVRVGFGAGVRVGVGVG